MSDRSIFYEFFEAFLAGVAIGYATAFLIGGAGVAIGYATA